MYLRFVVKKRGAVSGSRLGVVHAASELQEANQLEEHEDQVIRDSFAWLNKNLPIPTRVEAPGRRRAISWFKDDAEEPIAQMWSIVWILREHGVRVDVVKTSNPGRILYEDQWQVFALPLRDRNASF